MRRGPRIPWTAFACLAMTAGLAACTPTAAPAEPRADREVAFACAGDKTIVATFPVGGESVVLQIGEERVELPRAYAGTGAQYSEGTTTFFTTESGAELERGGETYADCVRRELPSQRWIRFRPKTYTTTFRWRESTNARPTMWYWREPAPDARPTVWQWSDLPFGPP